MGNWSYTTIKHAARKELGISPNEYCVLDYIFQTQTNPKFTRSGWCITGVHVIAEYFGFSTGTIHKMLSRFVENGLLEFDADKRAKRTTPKFYDVAYLDAVQKVNESVQKVNSAVQKVNKNRSKSEHISKEDKLKENREKTPAQFLVTTVALETIPEQMDVPPPAPTKISELQKNINAGRDAALCFLQLVKASGHDLGGAAKYAEAYFLNKQKKGEWYALLLPDASNQHKWIGEHSAGVRAWEMNERKFYPNAQQVTQAQQTQIIRDL